MRLSGSSSSQGCIGPCVVDVNMSTIDLPCHTHLICVCAAVRRRCRKRTRKYHIGGGGGGGLKQGTQDWRRNFQDVV